jgi:hypothetical protein
VLVDAVLGRGFLQIAQDRRTFGDGLLVGVGLEAETECVHVGVRAQTRVLEEVPGAAQVLSALENDIALVGAAFLQMPGRTDAGDAGSHDDNVDKFRHSVKLSTPCRISQRCVEKFDAV